MEGYGNVLEELGDVVGGVVSVEGEDDAAGVDVIIGGVVVADVECAVGARDADVELDFVGDNGWWCCDGGCGGGCGGGV